MHPYNREISASLSIDFLREFCGSREGQLFYKEALQKKFIEPERFFPWKSNCSSPNCISVSFFRANERDDNFKKKYYSSILSSLLNFAEDPQWRNWRVRVYISRDLLVTFLEDLESPKYCKLDGKLEFVVMKNFQEKSSINYIGCFWRFLAIQENFEIVRIADIDDGKFSHLDMFSSFKKTSFGMGFNGTNSVKVGPMTCSRNFAGALAGYIYFRPEFFHDIDVREAIYMYIAYRYYRISLGERSRLDLDEQSYTDHNLPSGSHRFGWGSDPVGYCFDEKFVRTVILTEALKKKTVVVHESSHPDEYQKMFLDWVKSCQNTVIEQNKFK
jgi:hypothetical protein